MCLYHHLCQKTASASLYCPGLEGPHSLGASGVGGGGSADTAVGATRRWLGMPVLGPCLFLSVLKENVTQRSAQS